MFADIAITAVTESGVRMGAGRARVELSPVPAIPADAGAPTPGATYTGNATVVITPEAAPAAVPAPGIHTALPAARVVSDMPGVVYTRQFVPGVLNDPDAGILIAAVQHVCAADWAAGLTPVVSIKPNVAQVAAGRWDQPLQRLGAWLAGQLPRTYVVLWHEPEDDMTADTFRSYFDRARKNIRSGGRIPVGYAAMAYQWAPSEKTGQSSINGHTDDPQGWASVQADFYGIDVYSGRSFPLQQTLPEHPGFARWNKEVIGKHPGRTWIVTERGFEATPANWTARANTINRETRWLTSGAAAGCIGYVYWNTAGVEGSTGLELDPDGMIALGGLIMNLAAGRQAAQEAVAANTVQGGITANEAVRRIRDRWGA